MKIDTGLKVKKRNPSTGPFSMIGSIASEFFLFFFQAEDGIRDGRVTGVQTCALPILVASKGGDDRDPDWFRNLMAHPEIELTMAGRRRSMLARRASAAEKAELWPRV